LRDNKKEDTMRKEMLLFFLPLFLFAGTTGKITGRVVDAQRG